ncbi:MAG: DUF349 domain-containing protein [Bacteroidetes bacterium HGW-Bacteroidetes-11]|jgi:hypothetical protein|nr:MAG: DUF349 domain-containing protein [Bacteroidetes bacterium HGW-Bacteroidetes-11]
METKPQSDLTPEEVNSTQEQNSVPSEEMAETNVNISDESVEETTAEEPATEEPALEEPSQEIIPEIEEAELPEVPEVIEETEAVAEVADVAEDEVVQEPESEETLPVQETEAVEPLSEVVAESNEVVEAEEQTEAVEPLSEVVAESADVVEEVEQAEAEVPVETISAEVAAEDQPDSGSESSDDDESDDQEEDAEEENLSDFEGMTREELVARLEELVKEDDVVKIKGDVARIKVAFLKLNKEFKHEAYQKLAASAGEPEAEVEGTETPENAEAPEKTETPVIPDDEVEAKFKAAFQIYKHNKFRFNEEQEKIKTQNLEAKTKILEELKALINSEETLKKTYDEFKILQDSWKSIGMVPKTEVNTLWQNYHFLVEKFFDKVKINKELKDLDLRKNLEAKMQLCGKAEELLLETSIIKSFKNLQQYHEEWKEIGPVPQDKKDELWDRFRSATEKINERRREYYNEMQEGLEQNLAAKTILCEKAEQLITTEFDSIKAYQDATNQITELLQIWKSLGPAPKKQNNEIWARFKTSLDAFFNAKKEFYNKLKEQQMHNYNLKLDLCVQAEALRASTDWRNTTRELINMQNEWKNIGPVPRKQSDKIWKRFRAACDEFFATKTEYFKNVSGHEGENMKLKLELIEKAKAFEVGENRNEAVEALKDMQRQWMEIGHVPIKEKEKLQADFRAVINKHFEKLKMETISMGATNYRNRVDRMAKDSPDAGRVISKERGFVQGKIQQLQDEIKTWENNIGFFAKSKTANLLKQEFEKKIDKAKEELQLLEAKLKMLRETNQ